MKTTLSLESLQIDNTENQQWLRDRMRELKTYRSIKEYFEPSRFIADAKLDVDANTLKNFLYHNTRLPRLDFEKAIDYMWDSGYCSDRWLHEGLSTHPASLFFSLCSFLEIGEQKLMDLRSALKGTFRIWRSSLHVPGHFVMGTFEITIDDGSEAIRTKETQISRAQPLVAGQSEVFEGFLVKKGSYHICIARQSVSHAGSPRMTVIHNSGSNSPSGEVTFMEGVVIGCYGSNTLFATPVYLERVEEPDVAALQDQIGIFSKIPAEIAAKLAFNKVGNVLRF